MWPWIPAAISALGSIGGAMFGAKGQKDANTTNRDMAREQMNFQREMAHSAESFSERMANTQVSRRVADLRAAGLNPALAYEGSAASPAGVTAGGAASRNENVMRDMPQVASTALAIKSAMQDIKQSQEAHQESLRKSATERAAIKAQGEKAIAERDLTIQNREFSRIQQPFSTDLLKTQALMARLGITGAENDAELERKLKALPGGSAKTIMQVIKTFFR